MLEKIKSVFAEKQNQLKKQSKNIEKNQPAKENPQEDPKSFVIYYQPSPSIEKDLEKKINLSTVNFAWDSWEKSEMGNVCKYIKEWKTEKMWTSYNKVPKKLKQIENINFPNLRVLCVSSNRLQTIENICRIRMFSLQILYLSDNFLSELQPIRKAYWPMIQSILIRNFLFMKEGQNYCKEGEAFEEFLSPKLQSITIDSCNDKEQIYTTKWVAKLESQKLKLIDLSSQFRLRKDNLKKCYERKVKKLKVSINIPFEEREDDGIWRFTMDM